MFPLCSFQKFVITKFQCTIMQGHELIITKDQRFVNASKNITKPFSALHQLDQLLETQETCTMYGFYIRDIYPPLLSPVNGQYQFLFHSISGLHVIYIFTFWLTAPSWNFIKTWIIAALQHISFSFYHSVEHYMSRIVHIFLRRHNRGILFISHLFSIHSYQVLNLEIDHGQKRSRPGGPY